MIVGIYAALLAFLFVWLSARTIVLRRRLKIGIGHGESNVMLRAMRVHSNFCEYVPIALVLALMVEVSNGSTWLIHFVCLTLLVGRCAHAWGVSQEKENFKFRVKGMALTFTSILISAISLLLLSFSNI